jgi:prolyl oligopeptidase family protein
MPDLSYDQDAPFDLTVEQVAERPGVVISECRFGNVEGEPVTGYLVTPAGRPQEQASVVYQHTTGGREAFLPEAIQLAEAGASALCLAFVAVPDPVGMIRQSIFAIRRGADILLRDVDRIGLVGHSGAAMMAATVSGIDRRFRCFVFEVGLSGFTFHWRDSEHPAVKSLRDATPSEQFEAALAAMSPYDGVHFVGDAAPAPLLFQFARFDIGVTAAESEAFYAAASEPKEQYWYDTGHVVNDITAVADRARFLATHLDLPELPGIVAKRVS